MFLQHFRELVRFSDEKMTKVNLYESSKMFCDLYCLQPAQSQHLHIHDNEEKVYFVLEGKVRVTVGERTQELRSGESCIVEAAVTHGVENRSNENAILLVFMAPHPSKSG